MSRIGDPTFGLDRYAWPLLSVLSTLEPDFADFDDVAQRYDVAIQTGLHHAGDRRWVSLELFARLEPIGPRKRVAFGRDPLVDEIVVESWQPTEIGTVEDMTPSGLRRFAPRDLMEAVAFVRSELSEGYRVLRASVLRAPHPR